MTDPLVRPTLIVASGPRDISHEIPTIQRYVSPVNICSANRSFSPRKSRLFARGSPRIPSLTFLRESLIGKIPAIDSTTSGCSLPVFPASPSIPSRGAQKIAVSSSQQRSLLASPSSLSARLDFVQQDLADLIFRNAKIVAGDSRSRMVCYPLPRRFHTPYFRG